MRGLWGNFWVRTVTAIVFAVAVNSLPLIYVFWGGLLVSYEGVLDFAGGSVVHITPWLPLLLFWGIAEIKAWRTGRPLPLGCYLIFTTTVTISVRWLHLWAVGFADWQGMATMALFEDLVSVIMAAIPTAIYHVLVRRRVVPPPTPDAF